MAGVLWVEAEGLFAAPGSVINESLWQQWWEIVKLHHWIAGTCCCEGWIPVLHREISCSFTCTCTVRWSVGMHCIHRRAFSFPRCSVLRVHTTWVENEITRVFSEVQHKLDDTTHVGFRLLVFLSWYLTLCRASHCKLSLILSAPPP